jgi:hypothetical protein
MSDPSWALLTDDEKGQLVSIWIIAADKKGVIPADPRILRKICLLDNEPNVNRFMELGFLEPEGQPESDKLKDNGCQRDVNVTSSGCQSDAPETETETETETEIGGVSEEPPPSANKKTAIPKNWTPSENTIQWALDQGATMELIDRKLVPEFIAYFHETGEKKKSWNSAFVRNPVVKTSIGRFRAGGANGASQFKNRQQVIQQQNSQELEGWEYEH